MEWTKLEKPDDFTEYACGDWRKITRPAYPDYGVTYMSYKLISIPCGNGKTKKKAFERFLQNIAAYRTKLDEVEADIQSILAEMEEKENA